MKGPRFVWRYETTQQSRISGRIRSRIIVRNNSACISVRSVTAVDKDVDVDFTDPIERRLYLADWVITCWSTRVKNKSRNALTSAVGVRRGPALFRDYRSNHREIPAKCCALYWSWRPGKFWMFGCFFCNLSPHNGWKV